jgi:hypothetical protein
MKESMNDIWIFKYWLPRNLIWTNAEKELLWVSTGYLNEVSRHLAPQVGIASGELLSVTSLSLQFLRNCREWTLFLTDLYTKTSSFGLISFKNST